MSVFYWCSRKLDTVKDLNDFEISVFHIEDQCKIRMQGL